jgi:hypothetical protein
VPVALTAAGSNTLFGTLAESEERMNAFRSDNATSVEIAS